MSGAAGNAETIAAIGRGEPAVAFGDVGGNGGRGAVELVNEKIITARKGLGGGHNQGFGLLFGGSVGYVQHGGVILFGGGVGHVGCDGDEGEIQLAGEEAVAVRERFGRGASLVGAGNGFLINNKFFKK